MSRFTHPVSPKTSVLRPLAITAALLLQAACGGGGDSSPPAATTGTSAGTTASSTITARLSGVAALGAPMAGARLQVVDGTGTLVGSTTTNAADGSFALTLQPATGPLLLQAVGTDAAGQPLVLHGAVPALGTAGDWLRERLQEPRATAILITDALRFDLGATLVARLNASEGAERATVKPARAPLPSITALGLSLIHISEPTRPY